MQPTLSLSRSQFRDALDKGLGRAVLHAKRNGLKGVLPDLRRACTRVLAYDPQCEWGRGTWLWKVIEAGRARRQIKPTILHALSRAGDSYLTKQLCELAGEYARRGDTEMKAALYTVFERLAAQGTAYGVEPIIRVDRESGFFRLARFLESRLPKMSDKDSAYGVCWGAEEVLGKARTRQLLRSARNLKAFSRACQGCLLPARRYPPRLSWKGVSALIKRYPGDKSLYLRFRPRTNLDVKAAVDFLLSTGDPDIQKSLLLRLNVSERELPYDPRFWKLAHSGDRTLRVRAYRALSLMKHDDVRSRALASLHSKNSFFNYGLDLFRANYRSSDARALFKAARQARSREQRHALSGLTDIGGARAPISLRSAYEFAYEEQPCSICRDSIFRKMQKIGHIPTRIRAERRYDCNFCDR